MDSHFDELPPRPIQSSDYSRQSTSGGSATYDLYGVSNHSGTLHGGHYTAYCRHPYKGNQYNLELDINYSIYLVLNFSKLIKYQFFLILGSEAWVRYPVS